jgi:hypothetical protein
LGGRRRAVLAVLPASDFHNERNQGRVVERAVMVDVPEGK